MPDDDDNTTRGDDVGAREAVDRLGEQNRVLVEARMLPTSRPLSEPEIRDVRHAFSAYVDAHVIKLARVAREVGYSPAVVSEWARGRYRGDVQTVTVAINTWMERDSRRRQAKRPDGFVNTWVAETIRSIAYTADKRSMMAAIVAPAGSGKTKVLKVLAEELRGVYVYCDSDTSGKDFFYTLAAAIGLRVGRMTKAALKRRIIEELANTHRIILLDEAHQLGKSIGSVRAIHDQAGVPIVMAGTADILSFVNDRTDGRGQFSSRCIQYNLLNEIRNAEGPDRGRAKGRDLFTEDEIKAFFASKQIRLATDALRLVWRLACLPNYGTLRLAEKIAEVALDISDEPETLSREDVMGALRILHNANARYLLQLIDATADAADEKPARVA
jgi:DNA transposition AAA+ family ATPase